MKQDSQPTAKALAAAIYACDLNVPVFHKKTDTGKVRDYVPTLTFSATIHGRTRILSTVSLAVSQSSPGPPRWMVWCPDPAHYAQFDDYDDGFNIRLHGRGEAHPRDTAAAAIQHALARIEDRITADDRSALSQVAAMLQPALERFAKAFAVRFRARAAA